MLDALLGALYIVVMSNKTALLSDANSLLAIARGCMAVCPLFPLPLQRVEDNMHVARVLLESW